MNKYFDTAMLATGVCSVTLATLSVAEDRTNFSYQQTLEKIPTEQMSSLLNTDFWQPKTILKLAKIIPEAEREPYPLQPPSINTSPPEVTPAVQPLPPEPLPKIVPTQSKEIVREFEGFSETAYIDTDGTPVIGYGFSRIDGQPVQPGDRIFLMQADVTLNKELKEIQQQIKEVVEVELNDNQLSALSSLAFNVGFPSIAKSTLVRKLNAGDYVGAAHEFPRWNKANIRGRLAPLAGLTRRRYAEKQLFLTPAS